MSNVIQVSTGEMKNKANELKNLNAKLKAHIENLISEESALNSMWDSEANDAFHKAFSQDVNQMNSFYNAIEKYASTLDQIAAEYEKVERTNITTATSRNYK